MRVTSKHRVLHHRHIIYTKCKCDVFVLIKQQTVIGALMRKFFASQKNQIHFIRVLQSSDPTAKAGSLSLTPKS